MSSIIESAEALSDPVMTFDILIMVFKEAVKLISHADDSSGALGEVVRSCTSVIQQLCQSEDEANQSYFFETIIKTAKLKTLKDWPDFGYQLMEAVVFLVHHDKQVQRVFEVFETLGRLYDGSKYPEEHVITYKLLKQLKGREVADDYLMEHIDVDRLRVIAVEDAFLEESYEKAEKLCIQALHKEYSFQRRSKWANYLERIYTETANQEKLTEIVYYILVQGHPSYYSKLQGLYEAAGVWEQKKEPMLLDLSKKLLSNDYASVLDRAGETEKLLELLSENKHLIEYYGKKVARKYPEKTYSIYEEYIISQTGEATERRKYKEVCKLLKNYFDAGAHQSSLQLIDRLCGMYPRRPAMLDEFGKLKKKLEKMKKA
ncbi:hypothetical protein ACFQ3W_03680 [Paenibacillus puldeungensis]|uniref:Uncharacterized protein n=2 Tax=Paenibacillus puldeungensis TaxID=696536 RepID=A0ABW3RSE4_9BACL